MDSFGISRLLGISLLVLFAAFVPVVRGVGQQVGPVNAEILSKRYSSGFFPVVGSYVEYEVNLYNEGNEDLKDQSLWVLLTSESNKTHSYGTYSVLLIEPQGSKTLHIGPFKMEEEGKHQLLVGMQGVSVEYHPDSFTVFRKDVIGSIFVGIALIIAGAGVVSFSLYRKSKRKIV